MARVGESAARDVANASERSNRAKRFQFLSIIVLINLALVEAASFAVARLVPEVFSADRRFLRNMSQSIYEQFLERHFDRVTGWVPLSGSRSRPNCVGEVKVYTYDTNGARVTPGGLAPQILTVGDSYTQGSDVSDEETFPSRLQKILGKGVVNYGVGGYGPYQAALRFEQKVDDHPTVRVAILGIMYENVARVVNSYRPAYHSASVLEYAFKPFLARQGDEIVEMANLNSGPAKTADEVRAIAERALREDFWARPMAEFPYTWAILRTVFGRRSNMLAREKIAAVLRMPRYASLYSSEELRAALVFVIRKFVDSARRRNIRPMIFFIPRDGRDRVSPNEIIATLRSEHPGLEVFNVGEAEIDWSRFNHKGYICHPSPYGYDAIARYVAEKIGSNAFVGVQTPDRAELEQ